MMASIDSQLRKFIQNRYDAQAPYTLYGFLHPDDANVPIDSDFVSFAFRHRYHIIQYLAHSEPRRQLVDECIQRTEKYTHERYQYIQISAGYHDMLRALYNHSMDATLDMLRRSVTHDELRNNMVHAIQAHHQRLRAVLASCCESQMIGEEMLSLPVVCSEYSAALQLSLLGTTVHSLQAPVLDIGCGEHGSLVRKLNSHGIEAWGMDRQVGSDAPFIPGDWLSFNYGARSWGTIIAHQSFSTHFIYNHHYRPRMAEQYARAFRAILDGLQPGGSFLYTPGLPFMEKSLSQETIDITRSAPFRLPFNGMDTYAYATRITKPR